MQPGIELVGVAQAWQLLPRPYEGLLHRVFGEVNIAKDQAGDREEPVDAHSRQRLKGAVVATLSRFYEVSRHPLDPLPFATDLAAFDTHDVGRPTVSSKRGSYEAQ